MLVKILSTEASLTTADNISSAVVVRILNDSGNPALITRADDEANTIGTITCPNGAIMFIEKASTDTLASDQSVKATSIAYTTG